MAKVRRGLSSIAQGVKNKFKDALKFGSERRNEVLDDLQSEQYDYDYTVDDFDMEENSRTNENIGRSPINNPVPPVGNATPTEDGLNQNLDGNMRALAKNIYSSNKVDETRTMFLLLINNYTRQIRENPANADELEEKLEIKKAQLDEFDKEITIIRSEEQIDNLIDSTNNILDEIEVEFDQLGAHLEGEPNYSIVMSLIGMLENKLGKNYTSPTGHNVIGYGSSVSTLAELNLRYKDLTGENYNSGKYINFFPENLIRKIYGELESNIRKNQAIIERDDTDPKTKETLNRLVSKLDSLIDYLPNLLKNPNEFDRIQLETDSVLDRVYGERKKVQPIVEPEPKPQPKTQPGTSENTVPPKSKNNGSTSLFVIIVEQNMKKIYEKVRELSRQFKASDKELEALVESYRNEIEKVTYLDDEIKKQIIEEAEERYNRKLCQEYGEDVYNYICQYSFEYAEKLEKLNSKKYGTPEFTNAYEDLMSLINNMIISGRGIGLNIEFNEETQTLNIDFNNENINKFTSQIVSDEIAKAMKERYTLSEEEQKNLEKSQFAYDMEGLFNEFDVEIARIVNDLPMVSNLPRIDSKINDLMNNDIIYPHLTMEDKKEITNQIENKHWDNLNNRYGENFLGFLNSVLIPEYSKIDFNSIEKYGLEGSELLDEYTKLTNSINEFKNNIYSNEIAKDIIESIDFNENTNMLTINYKNPNIQSFHKEVVDQEIAAKIAMTKNNGTRRQTSPVPPTSGFGNNGTSAGSNPTGNINPLGSGNVPPTGNSANLNNPSYLAAQEEYINKVNELNYLVEMINDINSRIESQATFNFLDINSAKTTISLEEEAQKLDQQLVSLRIELSRDRLNIKKQFNVFVLSIPEIKNIPMSEVEFSGSLNNFVAQRDEMIVEAEERIIELDYERKNNPENTISINEEISVLLKFIEAQNSIVGRRLVAECKTNDLNIVDTLKDRREKKKEMRAKLQNIKDYKTVTPQPTVNNNVEEEYRNEVVNVLKEELQRKILDARNGKGIIAPSTNLSSEVNQKLFALEGNPKYASLNTGKIRIEEIQNLDNAYKQIVEAEQLETYFNLIQEINDLTSNLTTLHVQNKRFADRFDMMLESIIQKYSSLKNLGYKLDLKNNMLCIDFDHKEFDFIDGQYKIEHISNADYKVLNDEVREIYEKTINSPIAVNTENVKKIGLYIIDYYDKMTPIASVYLAYNMFMDYNIERDETNAIVESFIEKGIIRKDENGYLIPLMNKEEFLENVLGEKVEPQEPVNPLDQDQKNTPTEVKISTRKLTFNPRNEQQLVNKSTSLVMDGDSVTISLLKNGIKIKYSQELREKLSKLNAKINLVNKENYRIRTSKSINETEEEQNIEFSDEREIIPEDYKIEIRVPDKDKSSIAFEYDLENVSEEIKSRSR